MAKNETDIQMERLGAVIRERRLALGMTQDGLSQLTRLHRNYIGGIERAERNVTIISLRKVAEGLDCEAWELLQEARI